MRSTKSQNIYGVPMLIFMFTNLYKLHNISKIVYGDNKSDNKVGNKIRIPNIECTPTEKTSGYFDDLASSPVEIIIRY